ncbi:MAG: TlpA family protein disulfide reductase [Gammaproteobacteria bacterium]
MKSPAPALLLLALALLQGCSNDESPSGAATTTSAAPSTNAAPQVIDTDARFVDLQGRAVELGAYAGKKVFLNYWATWCAPCIREIPSIARASTELEDEGYVFLLASDETLDTIGDFLAEREFEGNFIKLNKFFGAWGINAVPSSELYDESGNLVVTWAGAFEWDSPEMLDAIRNGTPKDPLPAR